MTAYMGADWSAKTLDCMVAVEGQAPQRIKGPNRNLVSVRDLMARVRKQHPDVGEIWVFIEAGAVGWVELLHRAGAVVHVMDPKQAKKYSESLCSSGAKDDRRDSEALLEMGMSPRHRPAPWSPPEGIHAELEVLGKAQECIAKDRNAAVQRLRSFLREKMPALEASLRSLSAQWVAKLLRVVPSPRHASELTASNFDELMKGTGVRYTTRAVVLQAIHDSSDPTQSESLAAAQATYVEVLVAQVELLNSQLKLIENQMDELTAHIDLRGAMEGIGGINVKMANRLIRFAFDEPAQHRDHASIKMAASPVFRGSGRKPNGKPKGHVVMRRAAPSQARSTAYLLGRLASQQLNWARARYGYLVSERGKKPATAYRIIARSLLRIITALARSGERYDNERYVTSLQSKGLPWAAGLTPAKST